MNADLRHLLPGETRKQQQERVLSYTGAMIWQDANGGPFESRAMPETVWCHSARPGEQSGTYFRSVRTNQGMTVWTWGGRDAETIDHLRRASNLEGA